MDQNKESQYQALSGWLMYRLESWRNHRDTNYEQKWDEYYRLWRGIWSSEDVVRLSEKSRIISPALQQAVEAAVAELEEATFGRGKWFDLQDDYLDQQDRDAEFVRNLLQEDLEKTGCKDAINEVFLNGAIYGTGIAKIVVEESIERVPSQMPIEGTMASERTVSEFMGIDVKVEPISPKEFIMDPSANSIDEALGVAHEVIKPRYHVIEGIKAGIYRDVPLDGDYNINDFGFDEEMRQADESDSVKITEYWGLVPKRFLKAKADKDDFEYDSKDEMVEAVVTVVNDAYILRAEENAFMMKDRPFIAYQHDLVPNKFWGRGICEKGYNVQKALDTEMRARIDSLALTTTPMMAADATKLPRGVKFEVRPGKTVLTNGDPRTALFPLNMGQTDTATFTQVNALNQMVQMATGSADMQVADRATSSGMSMALAASIKRQKRTLMNFQNTFLIPMINKSLHRKIQFDVNRYPVVDVKFIPYSTMGIMAKELEMQQMVQMMQSMPKDSPAFNILLMTMFQNSTIHNRDAIVNRLSQALNPTPEQQQMQQMGIQMQMQKAQAEIQKIQAEAAEENAKAQLHMAEAQRTVPDEADAQKHVLDMEQKRIQIAKAKADIANKMSETDRNIPETEHLKSETALNLATAAEKAQKVNLGTNIQ